jgi:hypothetical protein
MSKKPGRKTKGRKPMRPSRRGAGPMTSEDALAFIRNMQKAFPKRPRTKADKERLQEYPRAVRGRDAQGRSASGYKAISCIARLKRSARRDYPKRPKPRPSGRRPSSPKKPRR